MTVSSKASSGLNASLAPIQTLSRLNLSDLRSRYPVIRISQVKSPRLSVIFTSILMFSLRPCESNVRQGSFLTFFHTLKSLSCCLLPQLMFGLTQEICIGLTSICDALREPQRESRSLQASYMPSSFYLYLDLILYTRRRRFSSKSIQPT